MRLKYEIQEINASSKPYAQFTKTSSKPYTWGNPNHDNGNLTSLNILVSNTIYLRNNSSALEEIDSLDIEVLL